jgi:arsenate reductase (thioredoxin)
MVKVLFVCVQNSARSQMAEAYVKALCGNDVAATSAGIEPGTLNPLAVEVMREDGIDIAFKQTKSVFDLYKSGELFQYVITVCDEASAERCPVFAGMTKRLHWSFADPASFTGTREERLAQVRRVRDAIKAEVRAWCAQVCAAQESSAVTR